MLKYWAGCLDHQTERSQDRGRCTATTATTVVERVRAIQMAAAAMAMAAEAAATLAADSLPATSCRRSSTLHT